MARLVLSFLGSWQASLDGQPATGFESGKVRALLTYLAVEAHRPHYREALAGLLWPNLPEAAALADLRQALANLRKTIGDSTAHPTFLLITRETIQFNRASDYVLDVADFHALLTACDGHSHRRIETCRACAARLQKASDLYLGDFLEGFLLSGSSEFEEWTLIWHERLRRLALDAFEHLAEHYERRASLDLAHRTLARQLELDPWREEAHQRLMRVLARSGQRTAALAQYEACRRALAKELGVEPTAETIALYEQIKTGQLKEKSMREMPPLRNWTHPTTPLINRATELAELAELIDNPACRLITLLGPGGMGKTRLALEAAAHEAWSFKNGAAFVSLTPLSSSEFLVPALADAVGLAFHGPTDPRMQLLNYLREKDLLLIVDGFEHLTSEAGLLADVIEQAPRVVLLVTSRERIGIPSEWILDLQGLQYPRGKFPDRLESYSAPELFLQRAQMIRSGFSLAQENEREVTRICQLVEGMPLAIELAAGWLPALSCKEIVREIEGGLGFLAEHHQGLSQYQSMRAVFDRSWNLLLDEEKSMFRKLSVFRGGFSKEAAEQVTEGTLAILAALVDKSLVRRAKGSRYEMHDLIRQYAQEKLDEVRDEQDVTHERHCLFFIAFMQHELDRFKGPQQTQVIAAIMSEIDNVRVAWRWATIHRHSASMRKILRNLHWFFDLREVFQEALAFYTWTSQHLAHIDELENLDREHSIVFWYIECVRGWFLVRVGHYEPARGVIQQGVDQLRSLGAYPEMADMLHFLSVLCWLMGEYATAQRLLEEGLSIDRVTDDEWNAAFKLGTLGVIAQSLGDYGQANQLFLQALTIYKKFGDPRMTAISLSFIGLALSALGEFAHAQQLLREGLAISRELKDQWLTPITLNHLGFVSYMMREYGAAEQYHLESLVLFREIGNRRDIADSLCHLGGVRYAQRALEEAHQHYQEALQLASEIQAVPVELDALAGLTAIWISKNDISSEQACELASLIVHHPASTKDVKDRAEQLLSKQESQLPAEKFFAAKERGAKRLFEEVVEEVLAANRGYGTNSTRVE